MDKLAGLLDAVFIIAFGAWAYCVAKRKRRDEVGWLLVAGAAFWLPGYVMQDIIFPFLAQKLGWAPEFQEAWRKPSAFILGGVCALAVNLYLTLFLKPLPPSGPPEGGAPPAGDGGEATPSKEGGEAPPAGQQDAGGAPAAQQMSAAAPAAGLNLRADGPLGYLARYWPAAIVVLIYLLPTFEAVEKLMPRLGFTRVQHGPYPPYRELALPLLVGAQVWLLGRRWAPALLCALFCAAFIPEINRMEWEWSRGSSYYSHGYLVPFVVLWLVWMNRERLARLEPKGDLRGIGLAILAFGLLLLLAGAYLRLGPVQHASFIFVLCGLVFFLYGRAISRVLLFPLLFVVSMVPIPMGTLDDFTYPLKAFATAGTVRVVNGLHSCGLVGRAVTQEGSSDVAWEKADGTKDKLTVAEACSGLKSLIALLTFGALLAYLAKLSRRNKVILFLASVPIALLANMWRIVTLVLVASRWGSEVTHPHKGWVHDATGLGIFAVAFVLFFTFERVLRRFDPGAAEVEPGTLGSPAPA